MNFSEALILLKHGHSLKRNGIEYGCKYDYEDNLFLVSDGPSNNESFYFTSSDILADDWEIVNDISKDK